MSTPYLATTGLSEIWSRTDPVLLLGPWCRRGLNGFSPAAYEELPCIWNKEQSIAEAEQLCWEMFCRWTPRLGEALNEFHRADHSRRYWEILLSVWFLHFINVMYDRYLLIRSAVRRKPDVWTSVAPRENYRVATSSFSAIKGSAYDDAYNLQLFSEAARFLDVPARENRPFLLNGDGGGVGKISRRSRIRPLLGGARSNVLRLAVSTASRCSLAMTGLENGVLLCLGGSYRPLALLSLSLPARARIVLPGHRAADAGARGGASFEERRDGFHALSSAAGTDFDGLVLSSLPYFIPTCFVEGYRSLVAESREGFGNEPKSLVFDAPSLYDDASFLEYAARCAEAGKRLVSIQHGGAYGHTLSSPAERIEVDLCHRFFSFGWKDQRLPEKTLPLPNSHLSTLKRVARPGASILYVSFFGKTYLHRLVSVPQAAQWDDYLEYCETFLETLQQEIRDRIRFRPYFEYGGYAIPPVMESLMNGPQRESRVASRAILDCRLAVIDHASTSWIEALACNVPTVLFWNPLHWRFRPAAEPFLESLSEAGVLHSDPLSAARKVEEVYARAEDWWMDESIQAARRAFCKRYAWSARNWRRYWIHAFRELGDATSARKRPALVEESVSHRVS